MECRYSGTRKGIGEIRGMRGFLKGVEGCQGCRGIGGVWGVLGAGREFGTQGPEGVYVAYGGI